MSWSLEPKSAADYCDVVGLRNHLIMLREMAFLQF